MELLYYNNPATIQYFSLLYSAAAEAEPEMKLSRASWADEDDEGQAEQGEGESSAADDWPSRNLNFTDFCGVRRIRRVHQHVLESFIYPPSQ